MSYYNPLLQYGEERLMAKCKQVNVNGFIVVDLPPEEALHFRSICLSHGYHSPHLYSSVKLFTVSFRLSYIPLITPSTSETRISALAAAADSFAYVVSRMGVTGEQTTINKDLPGFLERIRSHSNVYLAVGFGVGSPEQFEAVAQHSDGVVIGSKFINIIKEAGITDSNSVMFVVVYIFQGEEKCVEAVLDFTKSVSLKKHQNRKIVDGAEAYLF
jgi:tryptophan synthase